MMPSEGNGARTPAPLSLTRDLEARHREELRASGLSEEVFRGAAGMERGPGRGDKRGA